MDYSKYSNILKGIIEERPTALENRSLLKALLMDFMPNERLMQNVLLMVFDEGIPAEIQKSTRVNQFDFIRYLKLLETGYGVNQETASNGILIWGGAFGASLETTDAEPITAESVKPEVVWENSEDTGEYEYEPIDGGIKITKFIGFDEPIITVPNMINGSKVLAIGNYAFRGCLSIEKIVIPEGVTEIGNGAFMSMEALSEVILPNTLQSIGSDDTAGYVDEDEDDEIEGAFQNSSIIRVVLPNNLLFIGKRTFMFCEQLVSVRLPDNVKVIKESTFSYSGLTSIDLPKRLEIIDSLAFWSCENPKSIVLPDGTQRIENSAFESCTSLSQITIPSSVVFIDKDAFDHSSSQLTILCDAGSNAMQYAREHGIKCAKR